MVNKRIGSVESFGACKTECQKGEPIVLNDDRYLQANRCPNGNVCVIVGSNALADTTVLARISEPTSAAAIYTSEELENLGYGNQKIGIGSVLSGIVKSPEEFVKEAEKPQAADPEFYLQYVDKLFEEV